PGGLIVIRAARDEDHVRISVTDTGVGIRPELLETIFDLFTQGDASSGRSMEGLGIGLHLARQLVVLHGGKITASSEGAGRGSEFILTLPASTRGAAKPHSGHRPLGRARPARRVLVVDDNIDAADSL